jgi:hypothetical protein
MAIDRSSSIYVGKMNLQSILNKNSPWNHIKSKYGALGIAGKIVKYVVHLFERYRILK